MLSWLDKADAVLAAPLHAAEPQHVRNTLSKVQVATLLVCVGVCPGVTSFSCFQIVNEFVVITL